MTPLFKKLNWKDQAEIVVLNAPESFEAELAALEGATVRREVAEGDTVRFALAFTTRQEEVDAAAATLTARAQGDATLWFAYPKGSSRRYQCEFNRDTGWTALGAAGWEPVRQVAVDEDWSALRFRRVEHIQTMRRNPDGALSAAGRAKAERERG